MSSEPRLTYPTLRVLNVLLEDPDEPQYGFAIAKRTKLAAGSLYPILARLERIGWLASEWEGDEPFTPGRPRRKYYRLTALGERSARAALLELRPSWSAP